MSRAKPEAVPTWLWDTPSTPEGRGGRYHDGRQRWSGWATGHPSAVFRNTAPGVLGSTPPPKGGGVAVAGGRCLGGSLWGLGDLGGLVVGGHRWGHASVV